MSYWGLRVTYCDVQNNEFLSLGGRSWNTKRERDANRSHIPVAKAETDYILDVESDQGIVDDQYIDTETVEQLLGKPIELLISEARSQLVVSGTDQTESNATE